MSFCFSTYRSRKELSGSLIKDIFLCDKQNMVDYWNHIQWMDHLHSDNFLLEVVFTDNRVIGFSLCVNNIDNEVHLLKICIDEKGRRTGLGKQLIFNLIGRGALSIYLEVRDQNIEAIDFYRSVGFIQVHEKKKYYSDGGGALFFLRKT